MTFATTLSRVAALCLLAGVAHASPVPAADGSSPVPATVYSPALPYRAAAPEPASPDRAWREQNRIVAGYNAMMPTMGAHGADPHAGHALPAVANAHAGHGATPAGAAAAPAPAADPHAGHQMHVGHAADGKAAPASHRTCCKGAAAIPAAMALASAPASAAQCGAAHPPAGGLSAAAKGCCGDDGGCKDNCCKDGCCCKGAAAGASHAGMQGCCAKGGANAPQSCAPARPAGAPAAAHQHGGHS